MIFFRAVGCIESIVCDAPLFAKQPGCFMNILLSNRTPKIIQILFDRPIDEL